VSSSYSFIHRLLCSNSIGKYRSLLLRGDRGKMFKPSWGLCWALTKHLTKDVSKRRTLFGHLATLSPPPALPTRQPFLLIRIRIFCNSFVPSLLLPFFASSFEFECFLKIFRYRRRWCLVIWHTSFLFGNAVNTYLGTGD
jgi:hypothetical protein